jgi:hypothetical protein
MARTVNRSIEIHPPRAVLVRRAAVSLADFLLLMFLVLGAGLVAAFAGSRFGWVGFLLGFPVGLFGLFFGFFGLVLTGCLFEALLREGIPYLPPCRNGKCRSGLLTDFGDYEWEQVNGEWVFRCRCGDIYQKIRKGPAVVRILCDGDARPYMAWRPFRGWFPVGDERSA